ncbi:MAG: class I SAM-dependent methyltransferase [Chloroflexi bacterium]|nr:class I SAM-dependent methyltransferase [Chloroflexota bacterium]
MADRYGLRFSSHSVQLKEITAEEAMYIQMFPLLNGPDLERNRSLRQKLAHPHVWEKFHRDHERLTIQVHEEQDLPPQPADWHVPTESTEQLKAAYPATLWGLQYVSIGSARILQAGSMAGHEPLLMRCLDPHRKIVVVDLLHECARTTRNAGLDSVVASLFALPMPTEYFDCVYNNNVMEHLYNDADMALREIHRVLKTGGLFSFVIPLEANESNPDLLFQMNNLSKSRNWWLVDPGHPWKTDLPDINFRLKETGFEDIRFAFRAQDLEAFRKRKHQAKPHRSWVLHLVEVAYLAFEESLIFHELESQTRRLFHFYRGMSYRLKIRSALRLRNRQAEMLQALVVARKKSASSTG